MKQDKVCFDRILPQDLARPMDLVAGPQGVMHAAFLRGKLWTNRTEIHVRFIGGTPADRKYVRDNAAEWSPHMGVLLIFDDAPTSQVRCSFDRGGGAWSYIGTDNLGIPRNQPTMNLGWLDPGTVRHEVGHMLGMIHEHQNPIGSRIQWNEQVVRAALRGPPNHWDDATINNNMFARYAIDQLNGSEFDSKSIMLYSFPASWTLNGFSSEPNEVLSAKDKQFANIVYPRGTITEPVLEPVILPVFRGPVPTEADIGKQGEEDQFKFEAKTPGRHIIETLGNTDVVMTLFDAAGNKVAQDDDSGLAQNAKIAQALTPGDYVVSVRHWGTGTGKYTISVREEK